MKNKSVLVVDDESNVCTMLALHLRGLGLQVETANSGQSAMTRLTSNRFDCVLTDLVMPDGDGFWLLEHIATLPHPPVVC